MELELEFIRPIFRATSIVRPCAQRDAQPWLRAMHVLVGTTKNTMSTGLAQEETMTIGLLKES